MILISRMRFLGEKKTEFTSEVFPKMEFHALCFSAEKKEKLI